YVGEMDRMFDTYARLLPILQDFVQKRSPKTGDVSAFAHRQAVRATCLDALRGLLPAGSLSNVGLYGSGQSYELLLLRMRAHPLPEAREYAEEMLGELRKVIPSFLSRVDRPERGGVWADYLRETEEATSRLVADLWPPEAPQPGLSVRLTDFDPDGEDKVLAAICFAASNLGDLDIRNRVARLSPGERARLLAAYVGERQNRRHRPGRAYERTAYRFDVVCDYGAFRDLQRHRMLTVEWQALGTDLGYETPRLIEEAGLVEDYVESLERSRGLHDALAKYFPEQCGYAVALAYNIRFSIQMNAREAMHLIELRSSPQGHPAYRKVAIEMHRLIAGEARHEAIASSMSFLHSSDGELGRLEAERRAEVRSERTALRAVAGDSKQRPRPPSRRRK
ncbi:MAG: FAD-dependent thymidylate synthase, partial [Acidimicrobiales bacterium]